MTRADSQGASPIPPGFGDRPARLHAVRHSTAEVDRRTRAIYQKVLDESPNFDGPNFTRIGTDDLQRLFDLYDAEIFDGLLARFLEEDEGSRLTFRLSSRMTRAAGIASKQRRRLRRPTGFVEYDAYEIAVSSTILFASFKDPDRPLKAGGRVCRDRLEALQRTFEHEMLHVAEFLAWGASSCSAPNFRRLSLQIFGHEASNHELMTPRDEAAETHGIRPGDAVTFVFEGVRRAGRVNRITRRATVLVEDPAGRPYTDGRTYMTFYVPVSMLSKVTPAG